MRLELLCLALVKVAMFITPSCCCCQVTQEGKEAEEIQRVVAEEEQIVASQGAKTGALKGTASTLPSVAGYLDIVS